MNENIDLTKILKHCPVGTKLYTPLAGEVTFVGVNKNSSNPIDVRYKFEDTMSFDSKGRYFSEFKDGECLIFPSKENREWSKFKAPWYKKEKFDPKTLQPFTKVLARNFNDQIWHADIFSHVETDEDGSYYNVIKDDNYLMVIPYNDDTKHLVGTSEEAPEYYRYWED